MRTFRLVLALSSLLLIASCSPKAPRLNLKGENHLSKVIDADNAEDFNPMADILFVVDDSGSMSTHQTNLANNIDLFTSVFLRRSILDYNIGVVTTDLDGYNRSTPCCGRLVGDVKIVNRRTPNADTVLAANIMVGTRGSAEERPLDAADLAFSTANLNGWNAGFHRPGSTLIVVFITDAEDQSQIEAKELMEKLVVLQRGDHRKVLLYGAIVPSSVTGGCSRDHGYPVKLELFLSLSDTAPNNVMSLCDPDFGSRLAEFAVDIVEKASSVMYLSRPPDVNSIRVLFGNMELPRDPYIGWSFDPRLNAISLGKNVDWLSQPAGSEVKVYYNEAEYK